MGFYFDMETIMRWVAGLGMLFSFPISLASHVLTVPLGPAEKLRLHEWKTGGHRPKGKLARRPSYEYDPTAQAPPTVTSSCLSMPSPANTSRSPTSSGFGGYDSSPATQSTSTPPVSNIWTSRLASSVSSSSSTSLYIVCKDSDARAQASRFPANGAHNGFRHPLYRESHQEERTGASHVGQLRSMSKQPQMSLTAENVDGARSSRDVSRTGSAKSMSSIRSNASTDTIQHILETDSADMVGFGRWRHHKDVSIEWLENKIREEFKGPGANCFFGIKLFATTDHPLVAELMARKRALAHEQEVNADNLTIIENTSSSSLFEPAKRTESSVSIGKDGCIVQTGFLTRSSSVGSTMTDISTSSSEDDALEISQKRADPPPKIFATSVNPDVELSASISAQPISIQQAEKLMKAASHFSQAAVSTSFLAAKMANEQRDSVLEQQIEAKQQSQRSEHVHFAPNPERRCVIVKPEHAENAIESDEEGEEILPLRSKTHPVPCSRPVRGILKRTSTGSGIATPEVSTPEVLSPSASSKALCMTPRPCSFLDQGYNIVAGASNATGMGRKRKSVDFAPRPQVYNLPAYRRKPTQRPRQRGVQRGPAIKVS